MQFEQLEPDLQEWIRDAVRRVSGKTCDRYFSARY